MRLFLIALCLLLGLPHILQGAGRPHLEFGIRGGLDAAGTHEEYSAREIYLAAEMPWQLPVDFLADFTLRLEIGAAQVKADGEEGYWLAAGGALVYRMFHDRLELDAGWRPTWLTEDRFGSDDFGGEMQFSSHIGAAFVWRQMRWSYRFQHTSNAGLDSENPGLDLHMFGIGFRF